MDSRGLGTEIELLPNDDAGDSARPVDSCRSFPQAALVISAVQAAGQGHADTLRASFDLVAGPNNDAVGRSFLIAPAILIPLGIVLLQTRLLLHSFGYVALAFGAASQALGLVGLVSQIAFADINPAVLALENLWLIVIAVALVQSAPEQPDHVRRHERGTVLQMRRGLGRS